MKAIDSFHRFFFDHPLDHVSGIQLVEFMSQVTRSMQRVQNKSNGQFFSTIQVSYDSFCLKETTTTNNIAEKVTSDQLNSYTGVIKQGGQKITNAVFEFSKTPLTTRKQKLKPNKKYKAVKPCPRSWVNKNSSENVLISKVVMFEEHVGVWLLPSKDLDVLGDKNSKTIDLVYLMETCRQSSRVFHRFLMTEQLNQKQSVLPPIKGMMAILKSMKISLSRPIGKTESVFLECINVPSVRIGRNHLFCGKTIIQVQNQIVGSFEMKSLLLDQAIYKNWRDDGVSAVFQTETFSTENS